MSPIGCIRTFQGLHFCATLEHFFRIENCNNDIFVGELCTVVPRALTYVDFCIFA
jgi:hypothetical protein